MPATKARKIGWGVLFSVLALSTVPAIGATSPGSITITSLAAHDYLSDSVDVEWAWKRGDKVSSSSLVHVYVTTNGYVWNRIAANIPIRSGVFTWDTTSVDDYAYAIKVRVKHSPAYSVVSPLFVDNGDPEVRITSPTASQIVVEGQSPDTAVIVGSALLAADARDEMSGIASLVWYLDGDEITPNADGSYDFSEATPGSHELSVVAADFAGNESSASIQVFTTPGPNYAASKAPSEDPGVPEDPTGGADPTESLPDPDGDPAENLPDEDPGVENPVPSDLPTALPTP
ncbi:MAG TPA: Ig-like domain-containing protein [Actinomycetota bacterium]